MTCLIIEDEAPAQRILQRYVADTPFLKLAATETNAIAGLARLQERTIDLLFLDIHLPKLTGIEFLRTLRRPPHVILTTAYPDYALESYELDVVDYLLKPFTFTRFLRAVNKARPQVPAGGQPAAKPPYFHVRIDKVIHRVRAADLLFCKAEGDFVRLVLTDRILLAGQSLASLETELRDYGVVRVHRSYLLRLGALEKMVGNEVVTARGRVPVGRKYREALLSLLR